MPPSLPSPLGQLIDVGSHHLHLYATGEGSPTVVLESGGASWSLDWYAVQVEVAKFTGVCAYDRAGFGWSDSGPKPRSSGQIVKELHALLNQAGIQRPYILVGASFGGHTARLYAKQHPDEVAGVILLDARHEAITSQMPPAWRQYEATGKGLYTFLLWAARLRLLNLLGRALGEKAVPPGVQKLPPEIRAKYLAVGFQPKYFQANLDELAAVTESDHQVSASGSLGDLPLTVIRHGVPDLFRQMPADQASKAEQVWQACQTELARLSTNSRHLVAEHSGHGIQNDEPGFVVAAIRQMVEATRQRRT